MVLIPGAALDPGAHWNYPAGYTAAQVVVWHYTVGNDSRALIRDQGLAPVLIRDDVIWEYAPLDAVCYTQCEWNRVAIGYEVESIDGSISPSEIALLGYATTFALLTFGIPQTFYDGPRLPIGSGYRGVTNHRNLVHVACDQHSDGFDEWVWNAAMSAAPPQKRRRRRMFSFLVLETFSNSIWEVNTDTATKVHIETWAQFVAQVKYRQIANYVAGETIADDQLHRTDELVDGAPMWGDLWAMARNVDEFNDVAAGGAAPGGGATPEQVQSIVQSDGNLTRQAVTADGNTTRAEVAKKRPVTGTVG